MEKTSVYFRSFEDDKRKHLLGLSIAGANLTFLLSPWVGAAACRAVQMALDQNSEVLSSGTSPVSNQLGGSGSVSRSVKLEGHSGPAHLTRATLNRDGCGTGKCSVTCDVGVWVVRPVSAQAKEGTEDVGADRIP